MRVKKLIRRPLGLAFILMAVCGLVFPLAVTGVGQEAFHYQANGSLAELNNSTVGSYLLGQSTASPYLFHIRNDSASGVDPDITVSNAIHQAARIHNESGVPMSYMKGLIQNKTQYTMFFFGTGYVNALTLNLQLINEYHGTIRAYGRIYKNAGLS